VGFWGNSIPVAEGQSWRSQRRQVQPALTSSQLPSHLAIAGERTDSMLDGWNAGDERDLLASLMDLTLEIASSVILGVAQTPSGLAHLLRALLRQLERYERLAQPGDNKAKQAFRETVEGIDAVLLPLIYARQGSAEGPDLLSVLSRARTEDGDRLPVGLIRDELVVALRAAFKNTAGTLSWTFLLLSQNPDVDESLASEASTVLATENAPASAVKRLPFAGNVLREAMRLHPLYDTTLRIATKDTEVGGYPVPEGAAVVVSAGLLQRDPRWFDDPNRFLPERWHQDLERRLPRFVYFPFGAGPRRCNAKGYALAEAILILAMISRRFRLISHRSRVPGHSTINGVLPRGGMPMTVIDRAAA
jgi:cytochrome P450